MQQNRCAESYKATQSVFSTRGVRDEVSWWHLREQADWGSTSFLSSQNRDENNLAEGLCIFRGVIPLKASQHERRPAVQVGGGQMGMDPLFDILVDGLAKQKYWPETELTSRHDNWHLHHLLEDNGIFPPKNQLEEFTRSTDPNAILQVHAIDHLVVLQQGRCREQKPGNPCGQSDVGVLPEEVDVLPPVLLVALSALHFLIHKFFHANIVVQGRFIVVVAGNGTEEQVSCALKVFHRSRVTEGHVLLDTRNVGDSTPYECLRQASSSDDIIEVVVWISKIRTHRWESSHVGIGSTCRCSNSHLRIHCCHLMIVVEHRTVPKGIVGIVAANEAVELQEVTFLITVGTVCSEHTDAHHA